MTRLFKNAHAACVAAVFLAGAAACAPPAFERDLAARRWDDAARTFAADSSLLDNERALYDAGVLYGSPSRSTYDPERSRELLRRLLSRFPETRYRAAANDRLALIEAVLAVRDSAAARERALTARIADLTADVQRLHASLDSVSGQTDASRRIAARLESDLRDRDDQLKALRLELQQLKEIDLKPQRPVTRPPR